VRVSTHQLFPNGIQKLAMTTPGRADLEEDPLVRLQYELVKCLTNYFHDLAHGARGFRNGFGLQDWHKGTGLKLVHVIRNGFKSNVTFKPASTLSWLTGLALFKARC